MNDKQVRLPEKEAFSFDKGINRKKSTLLLEEGELYSAKGFSYEQDGMLTTRTTKSTYLAIAASINGIHRYGSNIYGAAGENIYRRSTPGGTYSSIDSSVVSIRPRFCDYEKFTFMVDGTHKRAYVDGYAYDYGITNPATAPTLADGAAAGGGDDFPDGEYYCYVTFYVTFTNGKIVETGPSPSAYINTAAENKIEWSDIPVSTFAGTVTSIQRRLWRTVSGVAYLVTTLTDNTTTTYSDSVSDGTLQLSPALTTTGYSTPPAYIMDIALHLQRIFAIYGTTLYWSEAYQPFSFKTTSSGVVTKDNENLVGLVAWGDQLYMVSNEKWYRLNGTDPNTWSIKQTWSDSGICTANTIVATKYGMIGLWYDGIYNYDGNISKNLTERKLGRSMFEAIISYANCFATYDGTKYYFYYDGNCIVMDLTYTPDIRFYEDDFVADAHHFHINSGLHYFAKNGYEYQESGSETIATSFITGNKAFKNILQRKALKYFYYDIDTGGIDATVGIYVDGDLAQTLTLNTTSRQRNRSDQLISKGGEGYMMQLKYDCANSSGVTIYSPWALECDLVGE